MCRCFLQLNLPLLPLPPSPSLPLPPRGPRRPIDGSELRGVMELGQTLQHKLRTQVHPSTAGYVFRGTLVNLAAMVPPVRAWISGGLRRLHHLRSRVVSTASSSLQGLGSGLQHDDATRSYLLLVGGLLFSTMFLRWGEPPPTPNSFSPSTQAMHEHRPLPNLDPIPNSGYPHISIPIPHHMLRHAGVHPLLAPTVQRTGSPSPCASPLAAGSESGKNREAHLQCHPCPRGLEPLPEIQIAGAGAGADNEKLPSLPSQSQRSSAPSRDVAEMATPGPPPKRVAAVMTTAHAEKIPRESDVVPAAPTTACTTACTTAITPPAAGTRPRRRRNSGSSSSTTSRTQDGGVVGRGGAPACKLPAMTPAPATDGAFSSTQGCTMPLSGIRSTPLKAKVPQRQLAAVQPSAGARPTKGHDPDALTAAAVAVTSPPLPSHVATAAGRQGPLRGQRKSASPTSPRRCRHAQVKRAAASPDGPSAAAHPTPSLSASAGPPSPTMAVPSATGGRSAEGSHIIPTPASPTRPSFSYSAAASADPSGGGHEEPTVVAVLTPAQAQAQAPYDAKAACASAMVVDSQQHQLPPAPPTITTEQQLDRRQSLIQSHSHSPSPSMSAEAAVFVFPSPGRTVPAAATTPGPRNHGRKRNPASPPRRQTPPPIPSQVKLVSSLHGPAAGSVNVGVSPLALPGVLRRLPPNPSVAGPLPLGQFPPIIGGVAVIIGSRANSLAAQAPLALGMSRPLEPWAIAANRHAARRSRGRVKT